MLTVLVTACDNDSAPTPMDPVPTPPEAAVPATPAPEMVAAVMEALPAGEGWRRIVFVPEAIETDRAVVELVDASGRSRATLDLVDGRWILSRPQAVSGPSLTGGDGYYCSGDPAPTHSEEVLASLILDDEPNCYLVLDENRNIGYTIDEWTSTTTEVWWTDWTTPSSFTLSDTVFTVDFDHWEGCYPQSVGSYCETDTQESALWDGDHHFPSRTDGATKLRAYYVVNYTPPAAAPALEVAIDGPTSITVAGQHTWSADVTGGLGQTSYQYQWQYSTNGYNWSNVGSGSSYARTVNTSGAFHIRLNVTSGSATDSHHIYVTAELSVEATILGPRTPTRGYAVSWTASATGANGSYTYQWHRRAIGASTWTAVGTGSSYSPTLGYTEADFELRLIATSGTDSDTTTAAIHPVAPPPLTVSINGIFDEIKPGQLCHYPAYKNGGAPPYNFTWSATGLTTIYEPFEGGAEVTVNKTPLGGYVTLTVQVTSGDGQTASDTLQVEVNTSNPDCVEIW